MLKRVLYYSQTKKQNDCCARLIAMLCLIVIQHYPSSGALFIKLMAFIASAPLMCSGIFSGMDIILSTTIGAEWA